MKILFDQGTPAPLRSHLAGHTVTTAFEQGWSQLHNGDLLRQAEAAGFDLFLTTDQCLQYQQNLTSRQIAIVVLSTTSWPRIQRKLELVVAAVGRTNPGSFAEVRI